MLLLKALNWILGVSILITLWRLIREQVRIKYRPEDQYDYQDAIVQNILANNRSAYKNYSLRGGCLLLIAMLLSGSGACVYKDWWGLFFPMLFFLPVLFINAGVRYLQIETCASPELFSRKWLVGDVVKQIGKTYIIAGVLFFLIWSCVILNALPMLLN